MTPAIISRAWRLGLDLLYPPQCALCRASGPIICDGCAATLPRATGPRCPICWTATVTDRVCASCVAESHAFTRVRSPFELVAGARDLVHLLKYDGMAALAEPMAEHIAPTIEDPAHDIVVPVPLHPSRERSRGFNQAVLIARHLARLSGTPFDDRAVRRIRATRPLVRSMGRDDRRRIVEGAFSADPDRVDGRRILLIDDVITTGATLDACATALRAANAAHVEACTFAHAP